LQDSLGVQWVQLQEFSTAYSAGPVGFSPDSKYGSQPIPPGPPGSKCLEVVYIDSQQIAQPSLTATASDVSVDLQYSGGIDDL
jgi:hypothetical protein